MRRPTFTGTLTMRYRRGTPLGPLHLEGRIDREEGRKVFVVATISDAEGVTVEADGVFIEPSSGPRAQGAVGCLSAFTALDGPSSLFFVLSFQRRPRGPADRRGRPRESLKRPLTEAVRDLVDATIRTTVDDDEVRAVRQELEALVARLRAEQLPGSAGGRYNSERRAWHWGNAVIGAHNAIAPPMTVCTRVRPGHADIVLGAAYEGPPGLVHAASRRWCSTTSWARPPAA